MIELNADIGEGCDDASLLPYLDRVSIACGGHAGDAASMAAALRLAAEHGVAAHWMYKEAGARGYAGVSASGDFEERIAEARKAVLRELLAWERDTARQGAAGDGGAAAFDDRIYVFTPQATIIDLPAGGTAVDFAYALHTELGHRCRGARVDGAMMPLNKPLASGQTVEIVAAREGGPSLDWLNPELGYIASPRSRAKVRAWFNAQAQGETIARGREAVERLLQREGRTAVKLDALAEQLGFKGADALFEVVGKDEDDVGLAGCRGLGGRRGLGGCRSRQEPRRRQYDERRTNEPVEAGHVRNGDTFHFRPPAQENGKCHRFRGTAGTR